MHTDLGLANIGPNPFWNKTIHRTLFLLEQNLFLFGTLNHFPMILFSSFLWVLANKATQNL